MGRKDEHTVPIISLSSFQSLHPHLSLYPLQPLAFSPPTPCITFITPAIWFPKSASSNQQKLYLSLPKTKSQGTILEEMPRAYLCADRQSLRNCLIMVLIPCVTVNSMH